jgi:hypothetical protein
MAARRRAMSPQTATPNTSRSIRSVTRPTPDTCAPYPPQLRPVNLRPLPSHLTQPLPYLATWLYMLERPPELSPYARYAGYEAMQAMRLCRL